LLTRRRSYINSSGTCIAFNEDRQLAVNPPEHHPYIADCANGGQRRKKSSTVLAPPSSLLIKIVKTAGLSVLLPRQQAELGETLKNERIREDWGPLGRELSI
jgi:hypothetical protein